MQARSKTTPRGEELLGSKLAGFKLIRCIARGALASVFEGERASSRAAIKIYSYSWALRNDRNLREEQAQRQIDHPCVARALATDRLEDGSFLLASEWIDGDTLQARLDARSLAWSEIVAILIDVARGLGAIHAANIVHRDLKPSNIMLPASGKPAAKIVDFGHALVIEDTRLTDTGIVLGSAHYMAPEQAQGIPLDARADLYAVGVVLYRMLAGVVPFDHASPAEVMRMHQQQPVPPPHTRTSTPMPRAAEDLCMWLLAKDPRHRLPNAHVLRLTLEAFERTATTNRSEEVSA